jgi:hypothetical protein
MRMIIKRFIPVIAALAFALPPGALAQFGGRPGDVVIYAVTAKGSGDLQVLPPTTTNTTASTANFKFIRLATVPSVPSDPFTIHRQTLYEMPDETFMVGTDAEPGRGIHRLVLAPVKFMLKDGTLFVPGGLNNQATLVKFPVGVDVMGDVSLETTIIVFWAPMPWPFLQPTDQPGPIVPPGLTGIQYLFTTPGAITILSLVSWANLLNVYPGVGWPEGVDQKLLDADAKAGDTIRLIRIRPGKTTPVFRAAGHTHMLVLSGNVTLTPAGSSAVAMQPDDYAYVPENFAITLTNPASAP